MYPPLQAAAVGVPEHPPLLGGHRVHMVAWVLAAKYPALQVSWVLLHESLFNEGHVAHTDIPGTEAYVPSVHKVQRVEAADCEKSPAAH